MVGMLLPGFVFNPTDEQILDSFLKNKLLHLPLLCDMIKEADVYGTHPSNLTAQFAMANKYREWFFFTWTTRKHPDAENSSKASRVAGQGRWKSNQSKKLVRDSKGRVIGSKQNFSYMEQAQPDKEKKTIWLMEEYSIQSLRSRGGVAAFKDRKKLDDWVVCKIYLRPSARKELSGVETAAMEMRRLEGTEIGNQPSIIPSQDTSISQLAENTLPYLIDASDREMESFQNPDTSHEGIQRHPASHDIYDIFESLYFEQPAGAPNEGLADAPAGAEQHDMLRLPRIPHPLHLSFSSSVEILKQLNCKRAR